MKLINYIKKKAADTEATFYGWVKPVWLRHALAVITFVIPGGCFTVGILWWFLNLTEYESPFFWKWGKDE